MANETMMGPRIAVRTPYSQPGLRRRRAGLSAWVLGISLVMSYVPVVSTLHMCALRSLMGLLLPASHLPGCALSFSRTVKVSSSPYWPLGLHHWYSSLVSTINTRKPSFVSAGCHLGNVGAFLLHVCHEKWRISWGTQVTVILLVVSRGVLALLMPCTSLCVQFLDYNSGFQKLGPLPPFPVAIPLWNIILTCF